MGLFDNLLGNNSYPVTTKCDNCKNKSEVNITKGKTIQEVLDSGRLKCPQCGCEVQEAE